MKLGREVFGCFVGVGVWVWRYCIWRCREINGWDYRMFMGNGEWKERQSKSKGEEI